MHFSELHKLGKFLSLNARNRLITMHHSQKKQALPCDRRHDPVTSHPFTVQCAPWTGRKVTIPQMLSITQWSFSIQRPCKTTMYSSFYFICWRSWVHTVFLRMQYHAVLPYGCILDTSKNYFTCKTRAANCCLC